MTKDYYSILGVDKAADPEAIKKAYRSLSKKHHPDHGGDEEKFKEINEAYSTLSDPRKRQAYDNPTPDFSFADIFNGPFGGRPPFRQPDPNAPRRGRNIVLDMEFPIRHFIFGGKVKVKFSFIDPCPDCAGTGAEEKETCANCNGTGQVVEQKQGQGIFIQSSRACPVCSGRGFVAAKSCEPCNGSGRRTVDKNVPMKIPKGSREGDVIGATGEGGIGLNGGPSGDLAVRLHIKLPNPDELTDEQRKVLEELN